MRQLEGMRKTTDKSNPLYVEYPQKDLGRSLRAANTKKASDFVAFHGAQHDAVLHTIDLGATLPWSGERTASAPSLVRTLPAGGGQTSLLSTAATGPPTAKPVNFAGGMLPPLGVAMSVQSQIRLRIDRLHLLILQLLLHRWGMQHLRRACQQEV